MLSKTIKNFVPVDLKEMRFPGFLAKRSREIKQCVDNVVNGKGFRRISKCPICGCKKRHAVFSRCGIDILQCEGCTVGYTEKFPKENSDVYNHQDYLPIAKSDYLDNVKYRKERFAKERLAIIKKYSNKDPVKCSILDVGCGTGWFLEAAKAEGYAVFGQEFAKELGRFTAQRLGAKVWTEQFSRLKLKERFDVITLFDVIEHVPDPEGVLMSVKKHLKPKGIALIFTPNLDSFAFWKLKEHSSLVTPVEHLYYFTEKSLTMLIHKVDFEVVDFQTKGMDIPDIYSYYRDEVGLSQIADFLEENCSVLQAIIDEAKCANHMRVIIKK